jgi:D-alanyl-D-alanine carboxypeptidase
MTPVVRIAAFVVAAFTGLFAPAAARAEIGAYIVVDAGSGAVLAEKNAFQAWYPASITKLMTAYVTFRAMREGLVAPTSPVTITKNAASRPPSKMGFKVGTVITIDTALKIIIVKSANDIAVALGEAVGGSEAKFVGMMNAEARRLGMVATHFENPHGLPDDGQTTSARDMAVLARTILTEFPEHRDLFKITALQLGKKTIRTHNHLLERFRGTDGMKTGFICNSGFNVVTTATRGGRTLVAVVLGAYTSAERNEFAAMLLTDAFARPSLRRGSLATLAPPAVTPAAVSVREYVCGAKRKKQPAQAQAQAEVGESEDVDVVGTAGNRLIVASTAGGAPEKPKSYLEPRFSTMAPVPISLGGASGTAVAFAVPLPPLRPREGPAAMPGPDPATLMALVPPAEAATALPVASGEAAMPVPPAATAAPPPPLDPASAAAEVAPPPAPTLGSIASAAQPGLSVPLSLIPTTTVATQPATAEQMLGPRPRQN